MQKLRRFVLVAVLGVAVLSPGHPRAEEPATPSSEAMAAAQDLFSVIFDNAFQVLNARSVDSAWPGIESALRAQNPKLDSTTLAGLRGEYARIRLLRLHEITKDLPAIYARHLTAAELRDVTAFYRTPAGQKMLHVMPQVMTESFASVLPRVRTVNGDAHEAFIKLLRERGLL